MGSDRPRQDDPLARRVSIHAPAWGATRPFQFTLPHGERPVPAVIPLMGFWFQFTLPHGERLDYLVRCEKMAWFQFTLPHGERPGGRLGGALHPERFNSRSRMGSDMLSPFWFWWCMGFNSRSRMGSDRPRRRDSAVSIHAPAWGATAHAEETAQTATSFNSRSRMGSDLQRAVRHRADVGFNSRSRMGSD